MHTDEIRPSHMYLELSCCLTIAQRLYIVTSNSKCFSLVYTKSVPKSAIKPTSPYCKEEGGGNCVLMYSNKCSHNWKKSVQCFQDQYILHYVGQALEFFCAMNYTVSAVHFELF